MSMVLEENKVENISKLIMILNPSVESCEVLEVFLEKFKKDKEMVQESLGIARKAVG